jgi:hypothetical protein
MANERLMRREARTREDRFRDIDYLVSKTLGSRAPGQGHSHG